MMSKADRKKLCAGCRANRYNMGKGFVERAGIDAVVTVDECWHLASSKVVSKEVYFSPGDIRPFYVDRTLSCWHNNIGLGSIVKRVKGEKEMTEKKVPYVHSNFARVPGDYYPTIDKRCVYGFLQIFRPTGLCVDVCAPQGSGIVDTLRECGVTALGIPDAFADQKITAHWIVCNPPYQRGLVDAVILRQLKRLDDREVRGVAMLLRTNFDHAARRVCMFRDHRLYSGQIKLMFRPWWSEEHTQSPIHNFVWHIWNWYDGGPYTWYADGVMPKK